LFSLISIIISRSISQNEIELEAIREFEEEFRDKGAEVGQDERLAQVAGQIHLTLRFL